MTSSEAFLDSPLVVELGSRISVGFAGGLLAQLGATVAAVEPPVPSEKEKWARRPVVMAGKKSLCIDRQSAAGREELEVLLARADAVLLSTDVDVDDREVWSKSAPASAILCDVTAFGHTGPLANRPLSEGLVEAVSGIVDTTGRLEHAPVSIGTPLLEIHAALYATSAILAARRVRRLSGRGQKVDVALFDVGVTSLVNFLPLAILGKATARSGNRHPLYTPWGTYQTSDGSLQICAVTDAHWRSICDVMGRSELAADPRFATSDARLRNYRGVDEVVNAWAGCTSVAQGERALLARGIPCGPVVGMADIESEPNIRHRNSIVSLEDPVSHKRVRVAASPLRASPVGGKSAPSIPEPDQDRSMLETLRATPASVGILSRAPAVEPPTNAAQPALPYEGIRVIEIGQYTVAPMASRILGALGADVIKVESPGGDATRSAAPFRDDGASYIFAISNTDKRGVVLDLREDRDRDRLSRLFSTADVLVENLKPGSLTKLGFGGESLRRSHPNLIVCSVSGFGTDSAYPGRPALDTVIQAMSGLMDATQVEGEPTKAGISASDNLGGQFGLLAICAALDLRERTGIAVHIDLSMQDASVWATQLEWSAAQHRSPRPKVVPFASGYVAIERAASGKLTDEAIRAALDSGAAAEVLSATAVMQHPQVAARKLLVECPTVEGDRWLVFSLPFKMLSSQAGVRSVMASLGATDSAIHAELDRVHPKAAEWNSTR